jgi:HTH-type transcriptional regulator / antitoxin HipB
MKRIPSTDTTIREVIVRSSVDLGKAVKDFRTRQNLNQLDLAGLANTGNRFLIELERGKPTVQLQKALEVLQLLGLEVIVRKRGGRHGV